MEERDPLSAAVIGAAIEVHKLLGPGLLEVLYHRALRHELALRAIPFASEQPVPVHYKGHHLGDDLRLDLVVSNELIVELKAVEHLHSIHDAQLITYLKLTGLRKGLLLNFNVKLLKDGIKRIVL
ncbi:GxxExxY protein [Limnoglobus roseus]|uniref:GxxExxY protein n=1 Tax=Limnoglobus roseus TaxID=2598579 RepID=A0A5C1A760_9BACT|nr:GxxExxY protein [Limnoglobus roseus]QEL14560.1 GxxExxY protein [Limnoglobus roseus]